MKLRKVALLSASALLALSLTGCDSDWYEKDQQRNQEQYRLCVENGGSWLEDHDEHITKCTLEEKK